MNGRSIGLGKLLESYKTVNCYASLKRPISKSNQSREKAIFNSTGIDQTELVVGDGIEFKDAGTGVTLDGCKCAVMGIIATVSLPRQIFAVVMAVAKGQKFDPNTNKFYLISVGATEKVRRSDMGTYVAVTAPNLPTYLRCVDKSKSSPKGSSYEKIMKLVNGIKQNAHVPRRQRQNQENPTS